MRPVFICTLAAIAIFLSPIFVEADINGVDFLTILGRYEVFDYKNVTIEQIKRALRLFQVDHELPLTGIYDGDTSQKMNEMKSLAEKDGTESPDYQIVSKWSKRLITWRIIKYSQTSRLKSFQQRRAIVRAFQQWADVSPLVFKEVTYKSDIDISFEFRIHPPNHVFSSISLAHADFPPSTRGIHFWDKRRWTLDREYGYNLETVALHEIGHSLGLNHSNHRTAVMYRAYRRENYKLSKDDIAGIQANYGPKPGQTTEPRRLINNTLWNITYRTIDAAFEISGDVFLFLDKTSVIDSRNRQKMNIEDVFPGGPDSVQAAVFSNRKNKAFLYKDTDVWAYSLNSIGQFHLVAGYPKYLANRQVHYTESIMKLKFRLSEMFIAFKDGFYSYLYPGNERFVRNSIHEIKNMFSNMPEKTDAIISCDADIFIIDYNIAYRMSAKNRIVDSKSISIDQAIKICQKKK